MSQQDLAAPAPASEPVVEQKQRNNIYTMMLILAFISVTVACVLLWMELQEYGSFPWWKTSGVTVPATSSLTPPSGWLATLPITGWWV